MSNASAKTAFKIASLPLALGFTFLGLIVAFAIKYPCTTHGWDGYQYSHLCYNDLQPLYYVRGVSRGLVPYRDVQVEYPVLTGAFMDVSGRLLRAMPFERVFPDNDQGYFRLSAILLSPFAFVVTASLRKRVPATRLMLWTLGTPTILYSFHNWDLIAVAGLAWGLERFEARKEASSGIGLALGASAKLFPGFAVPAILCSHLWRKLGGTRVALLGIPEVKRKPAARFVVALVITALVVNVPWMIVASGTSPALSRPDIAEVAADIDLRDPERNGWLGVWQFHARRYPDFGTVWYWIAHHARALVPSSWWDPGQPGYRDAVSYLALVLFAAGTVAFLLRGWARRTDGGYPVAAVTLGITVCFLLASKVHSPQYALWLVPLMAMLSVSWWAIAAYFAADLAVYISGFYWFTVLESPAPAWKGIFEVSVLARAGALGFLAWSAWHARSLSLDADGTMEVIREQ